MLKKKRRTKQEFSKFWVAVIIIISLIDLNILIFEDRMETLAVAIVTEILGLFGGYMVKAYFGKKNEELNKLTKEEEDGVG